MFPLDSSVFKACIQPINKSYLLYLQNITQITCLTCGQPWIQSIRKHTVRQTDRQIDMHTPEHRLTRLSHRLPCLRKEGRRQHISQQPPLILFTLPPPMYHLHTQEPESVLSPSKEAPGAHPLHVIFLEETHSPGCFTRAFP